MESKGVENLKPQFGCPYKIVRKVGEPSYKLDLHESSKVHNVFHVSCLKKVVGKPVIVSVEIPPMDDEGKRILV